jgi:hypothetical protein
MPNFTGELDELCEDEELYDDWATAPDAGIASPTARHTPHHPHLCRMHLPSETDSPGGRRTAGTPAPAAGPEAGRGGDPKL